MALIETNFIRPQEVYDRNTGESKVRYRSYDGNDSFIPVVDGGKGVPKTMVEVTHAELKAMRDGGKLTAGALYRITDYNCTTTQENTQSAGHQFDIVLLALSEDKLAEEGWAMMNDNIYDVTFNDGVTKKCYIYCTNHSVDEDDFEGFSYNVVQCDTLLGQSDVMYQTGGLGDPEANIVDIIINEENKTANCEGFASDEELEADLTYNYFQHSNLSAWKVWYCLDNDKSRFAWADDSIDETVLACITTTGNNKNFYRNKSGDVLGANLPYAWTSLENETKYTRLEEPDSGRIAISNSPNDLPASVNITFTPGHEGTNLPNGRGVIYRLIDEWNNDVGYDFKNIQLYLPIVNGEYDANGEKTWVYTFSLYNRDKDNYEDGSLKIIEVSVDDTFVVSRNNIITSYSQVNRYFDIPFNLTLGYYSMNNETGQTPRNCIFFNCKYANIQNVSDVNLYNCEMANFVATIRGIYYNTKKVLTES